MKTVDTRGYSCPEPVIRTKMAVEGGDKDIEVLLDSNVSVENVTRYLESQGFSVKREEKGGEYTLKAKKNA